MPGGTTQRILILFHEDNHETAEETASSLRSRGFGVSFCHVDDNPLDASYLLGILHSSDLTLAFLSKSALQNVVFKDTLKTIREQGSRAVPLILEPGLDAFIAIPAYAIDLTTDVKSGMQHLLTLLERLKTPKQPPIQKTFFRQLLTSKKYIAAASTVVLFAAISLLLIFSDTTIDKKLIDPTQVAQETSEHGEADDKNEPVQDQKRTKPDGQATGVLNDPSFQLGNAELENADDPRPGSENNLSLDGELYADFISTPFEGAAPLLVIFEDYSSGEIARYEWDFNGDGTVDSTHPGSVEHTYRRAGTFEVILTIYDETGESDTFSDIVEVYSNGNDDEIEYDDDDFNEDIDDEGESGDVLQAQFNITPDYGNPPLTVEFKNTSTGTGLTYAWDFDGDGEVDSTRRTPAPLTYRTPGDYEPSLIVSGPGGKSEPEYEYITVDSPEEEEPPMAIFVADPVFGTAPLTVNFENRSIGNIYAYSWDFNGDGVVDSTAANPPAYVYTSPGEYRVSLVVTGPGGRGFPEYEYISVDEPDNGLEPMAIFVADPVFGTAPLTVNFENRSIGEITSYAWDFDGDGKVDSTAANPPAYTYTTPGDYEPSLVVAGPGGTSTPENEFITVEDELDSIPEPVALFVASPSFGTVPLSVSFENRSLGQITSYAWDFNGDGKVDSTLASPPPYVYTTPGDYEPTLVAKGPGGKSEPEYGFIIVDPVEVPEQPIASFTVSAILGTAPLRVTFQNTSIGQITSYAWDFNGDGVTDSTSANPPAYTYHNPGEYNVRLVVKGPGGTSAPESETIIVEAPALPPAPLANFSATPLMGTSPLVVNFTNRSSGTISQYAWDFNDDGLVDSTAANPPAYTYAIAGDYTVSLTVRDSYQRSDTYSIDIFVDEPLFIPDPLTATFTIDPLTGTAPLAVTFTNGTVGMGLTFSWDFDGDGIEDSEVRHPGVIIYTAPGVYNITLTVEDTYGQIVKVTRTLIVLATESPLKADFAVNTARGEAPFELIVDNRSMGDIVSYAWDFNGDGFIDSAEELPDPYEYDEPGVYTASLVVRGNTGGESTRTMAITVDP